MQVSDDGEGFDTQKPSSGNGLKTSNDGSIYWVAFFINLCTKPGHFNIHPYSINFSWVV